MLALATEVLEYDPHIPQYSGLGEAIRSTCEVWCRAEDYSDPFCKDGEWWAFPPGGVMPVRIKTVMGAFSQRQVRIDRLTLSLFPDGSLASKTETINRCS